MDGLIKKVIFEGSKENVLLSVISSNLNMIYPQLFKLKLSENHSIP